MPGKKHGQRPDNDPTAETESIDFDGTQNILLGEDYRASIVAAHERSTGQITHDARGQASWKWSTTQQPGSETDKTYNLLKALDTDALAVTEAAANPEVPASRKSGFDPYDTARSRKPK